MPRDAQLERLVRDALGPLAGLSERPMFGGLAFLVGPHLLCAASARGLMARLGRGCDAWALDAGLASRVEMRGRPMPGWVRAAAPGLLRDPALLRRLLDGAMACVATLPSDDAPATPLPPPALARGARPGA